VSELMNTTALKKRPIGKLAFAHCNKRLEICVLKSNAGYYIGTADEDGPCSRESVEYWRKHDQAASALETGDWTQKEAP